MQYVQLIRRFSRFFFLALVLVGISLPTTVLAIEKGYYKWVDRGGRPQHSDRPPPPGIEYDFVSMETGLSRRVTLDEMKATDGTVPSAPRNSTSKKKKAVPTGAQIAAEKNPQLCDHARANLDTLNSKARVRIRDDKGDIRYLTPDEKDVQRQKAQDLIAVHCA
jgi:hypothetical protein